MKNKLEKAYNIFLKENVWQIMKMRGKSLTASTYCNYYINIRDLVKSLNWLIDFMQLQVENMFPFYKHTTDIRITGEMVRDAVKNEIIGGAYEQFFFEGEILNYCVIYQEKCD